MTGNPILWNLECVWQQTMAVEVPKLVKGTTTLNLKTTADIDRALARQNVTVTADGSLLTTASVPGVPILTSHPVGTGTIKNFKASRRFDTGLPNLKGDDDPSSSQPADSFRINPEYSIPALQMQTSVIPVVAPSKPTSCEMLAIHKLRFDLPYHPGEQETHEGSCDLRDWMNEQIAATPIKIQLSDPKSSVNYTLNQKKLRLEFQPSESDLLGIVSYKDLTRLDPIVALDGSHYPPTTESGAPFFVHASYRIQAYVNEVPQVDVSAGVPSSKFYIWRIVRSWDGNYDPGTDTRGDFTNGIITPQEDSPPPATPPGFDHGWFPDDKQDADWLDTPGKLMTPPSTWTSRSTITEFLVSVKNFPEFRFLYFAFIFDFQKGSVRVRSSALGPIPLSKAKEIYSSLFPYCILTGTDFTLQDIGMIEIDEDGIDLKPH